MSELSEFEQAALHKLQSSRQRDSDPDDPDGGKWAHSWVAGSGSEGRAMNELVRRGLAERKRAGRFTVYRAVGKPRL